MKRIIMALLLAASTLTTDAAPLRVALIDVQDLSGMASDPALGGAIQSGKLAEKAIFSLAKQLVNNEAFTLIDRRDFMDQMERYRPKDLGEATPFRPSFLQAAQALRADLILKASILSLSTGKQTVNQGGYKTDQSTLALRVSIEALDAKDGAVVAITEGSVRQSFRQTDMTSTTLSEDDVLQMLDKAFAQAIPAVEEAVAKRAEQLAQRPTVMLAVKTDADPALLEVDGLLVGSTPVTDFQIYQGDHVIRIGKPGYQQVTKKVLFEKDTTIEVPMIREQLTAEELKEIYEKIELKVIDVEPGLIINTID